MLPTLTASIEPVKKVHMWTINMGRWRLARQQGIFFLDITAKSGVQEFAPFFHNVMLYKRGEMSSREYTDLYHEKMHQSQKDHPEVWDKLKKRERIAFACYCAAGKFCHRHLFTDLAVRYLNNHGVDAVIEGELSP